MGRAFSRGLQSAEVGAYPFEGLGRNNADDGDDVEGVDFEDPINHGGTALAESCGAAARGVPRKLYA